MDKLRPELLALAVNVIAFLYYMIKFDEPYKTVYWAGAVLLAYGLYGMKG